MDDRSPSDTGFCLMDGNADLLAHTLVRRVRDAASALESDVNRLYRGRGAVALGDLARVDLERTIKRLAYMAETLREVERAQSREAYLQAAE